MANPVTGQNLNSSKSMTLKNKQSKERKFIKILALYLWVSFVCMATYPLGSFWGWMVFVFFLISCGFQVYWIKFYMNDSEFKRKYPNHDNYLKKRRQY